MNMWTTPWTTLLHRDWTIVVKLIKIKQRVNNYLRSMGIVLEAHRKWKKMVIQEYLFNVNGTMSFWKSEDLRHMLMSSLISSFMGQKFYLGRYGHIAKPSILQIFTKGCRSNSKENYSIYHSHVISWRVKGWTLFSQSASILDGDSKKGRKIKELQRYSQGNSIYWITMKN